jgi:hypothetical protein
MKLRCRSGDRVIARDRVIEKIKRIAFSGDPHICGQRVRCSSQASSSLRGDVLVPITRSPDHPITRSAILFFLGAVFLSTLAPAQNSSKADVPSSPTVTYDVFWEPATPQGYTVTVSQTGSAKYVSRNPTKPPDANGERDDDYELEFNVSPVSRDRIFILAKQAGYFDGDFDYHKHAVASTGKKTLSYVDAVHQFQTKYDYSENPTIAELTSLFSGISNTIEYGRRLQFKRRFDKLGLEAELKGMEHMAENKSLAELQLIAPLLENIANDTSVLHIARQRARRLLEAANSK